MKYRNGFLIRGRYKARFLRSSNFSLTTPAKQLSIRTEFARHRAFCRTTETGVRDFRDISARFAAPNGSQPATTDRITNDNTLVILGTAEANATVEVFLDGVSLGTATADGAGGWAFDHTGTVLADGSFAITAQASDGLGNPSPLSAAFDITIDTAAPAVPVIAGITDDTGAPGDGVSADTLTGGAGTDTFVYGNAAESTLNVRDLITDFEDGTDVIDLSALGFSSPATDAVLDKGIAGSFTNTDTAGFFDNSGTDRAVAFENDWTNTRVYVDADGDGNFSAATDMVIQITGLPTLYSSDFYFIL